LNPTILPREERIAVLPAGAQSRLGARRRLFSETLVADSAVVFAKAWRTVA
jgi:hypothetical protein